MPEQQSLSDFLSVELKDYARLEGKVHNHSNSMCIWEGEEDFTLLFYGNPPQDVAVFVSAFYKGQGLETTIVPYKKLITVYVKKNDRHVKYVVIKKDLGNQIHFSVVRVLKTRRIAL